MEERTGPIVDTDVVAAVHWPHDPPDWHHDPLRIPFEGRRAVRARAVDADGEEIPLGDDETYRADVAVSESTPADLLEIDVRDDRLEFYGATLGSGELLFELLRDDETVWTAPPLRVWVTDRPERRRR